MLNCVILSVCNSGHSPADKTQYIAKNVQSRSGFANLMIAGRAANSVMFWSSKAINTVQPLFVRGVFNKLRTSPGNYRDAFQMGKRKLESICELANPSILGYQYSFSGKYRKMWPDGFPLEKTDEDDYILPLDYPKFEEYTNKNGKLHRIESPFANNRFYSEMIVNNHTKYQFCDPVGPKTFYKISGKDRVIFSKFYG